MFDDSFLLDRDTAGAVAMLDALATDGSRPASIRIGLDNVAKLEAPIIARLLAAKKRASLRGGTFVLIATRRDLLATLHVTGLDTVFTIEAA